MFNELRKYLKKPELYAPSAGIFWDDEHISKGMLVAHLAPHRNASTRSHDFFVKSVEWITSIAPPIKLQQLLD